MRAVGAVGTAGAILAASEPAAIAAERAKHALFAAVTLDALRILGDGGLRAEQLAQAIFELGRCHQSFVT
jgi:hypothetical protein